MWRIFKGYGGRDKRQPPNPLPRAVLISHIPDSMGEHVFTYVFTINSRIILTLNFFKCHFVSWGGDGPNCHPLYPHVVCAKCYEVVTMTIYCHNFSGWMYSRQVFLTLLGISLIATTSKTS